MEHGRPLCTGSRCAALLVAVVLLCSLSSPAFAGDWTVGEIVGPAGVTRVQPMAVNAGGVVVGIARFPGRSDDTAFRWEDGTMIELELPAPMTSSLAYDINDAGTIVGMLSNDGEEYNGSGTNGVVWSATKTGSSAELTAHSTDVGGYDSSDRGFGSAAFGINEKGHIVGTAGIRWENEGWPYGYSYNHVPARGTGGSWSRLPLPDSGDRRYGGQAVQINENGLILGNGGPGADRATLSTGGLPDPALELFAGRQGLNDLGHVVGRVGPSSSTFTARMWDGTRYVELGADQPQSMANAVNNADWAVGRVGTEQWQSVLMGGDGMLWRPDEAPALLYTLAGTGWSMYNGADINDDGMIVGTGRHGGRPVGFWMAPASIAHKLDGKVHGPDGAPVAGARLTVHNAAGQEVAAPVTGSDGRYEVTLERASYAITVQPDGAYRPDGLAGCTVEGSTCKLSLSRNKTVDFYGVDIEVPPPPSGTGDAPAPPDADTTGPAVTIAGAGKTLKASKKGVVGVKLGPFAEPVAGSVALQTATKMVARAAARKKGRTRTKKPAVLKLGSKSFTAAAESVVVKVALSKKARRLLRKRGSLRVHVIATVRDGAGNRTVQRATRTLKAAKKKPR